MGSVAVWAGPLNNLDWAIDNSEVLSIDKCEVCQVDIVDWAMWYSVMCQITVMSFADW